ncbi:hypothetical protein HPB50_000232 [Hyalomma asiaticum]|uniref:Uncharacterized protein n=1 Tax=Hyalomma asiaticum TaxID=266040 RepID=A0ACB7SB07_HYAAI|nr:hypothetical protein HPB50_000232 [Hyalomma asiaticum]
MSSSYGFVESLKSRLIAFDDARNGRSTLIQGESKHADGAGDFIMIPHSVLNFFIEFLTVKAVGDWFAKFRESSILGKKPAAAFRQTGG